jgi:hypothetical protein
VIRTVRIALVLAGVSAVNLMAQGSAGARFQYERIAEVIASGSQRLDVDVALLTGSQPFAVEDLGNRWIARRGLADLRLFNENNVEVPYLLVEPTTDQPAFARFRGLPVATVERPGGGKTSGFEVDAQSVRTMDGLVLSSIQPPFLKRFQL